MAPAPRRFHHLGDVAERKVVALRGSGYPERHLRLAVDAVVEEGLPLRDAPVLRHAKRLAEAVGSDAAAAWQQARERMAQGVPENTFRQWLDPLTVIDAEGSKLVLTAPADVRKWVEYRFLPYIREALGGTGFDEITFLGEVAA